MARERAQEVKMKTIRSCFLITSLVFVVLFAAATWRIGQFELIGYRLGVEAGEEGRVATYLDEQVLVIGNQKELIFEELSVIPHKRIDYGVLNYAPDGTANCYRLNFPRWLFIYTVEPSRIICFDDQGLLNHKEEIYS